MFEAHVWVCRKKLIKQIEVQIRALSVDARGYMNSSIAIIQEFNRRKALADIGFVSDLSLLDGYSAQCLLEVGSQIEKAKSEREEKARRRK